jgi:iron complex outermembrane recepter protein
MTQASKKFWLLSACASVALMGQAYAQTAPAQDNGDVEQTEEIIVTGSLIRGAAENAALPVDVISAEELSLQGSPSTLDLLKSLPVSSGILGDSNQFDARAQGSEGSGSVNLRGLGAQRTLVLFNGRRLPVNPFAFAGAGAVDTNVLPIAAIGRVEILKDGAAATYGSDAVAGVVNFITQRGYEGLEVGGNYRYVEGSDGDFDAHGKFGWANDWLDFFVAGGYQHRAELRVTDRDFAVRSLADNPEGGFSLVGNPGAFLPITATGTPVQGVTRDPACTSLGGQERLAGTTPVCGFQFTPFDNLVEKQNRFQIYSEINAELPAGIELHVEGLYARTEVPQISFSPSFPPVGGANAPTADASLIPGQFFVPRTNPGLVSLLAQNPTLFTPTANAAAAGVLLIATRPFGVGGNSEFPDPGATRNQRSFDFFRFNSELKGSFAEWANWSLAVTYGEESAYRNNFDTNVNNFALALRGLGGDTCNRAANTPGANGCLFFNPFSTAIAANAVTGVTNPQFNPAVANSSEVINFIYELTEVRQKQTLLVIDGQFDGQLSFLKLPGGEIGYALGGQYRRDSFQSRYSDNFNLDINPCINTETTGNVSCAVQTGLYGFLTGSRPVDVQRSVFAFFGEISLPFTEKLNGQFAARYENYPGSVGSTFNPKFSLKYDLLSFFALRGTVGTTFRGPSLTESAPNTITSLQNIGGTFRAVDISGNSGLTPERAFTFSAGGIFELGHFKTAVDYWSFNLRDTIGQEPVAGLVNALFPTGAVGPNNCGAAALAEIQARFIFSGACAITNVSRLNTFFFNGPRVKTTGIDILSSYEFENFLGGAAELGGSISWTLSYDVGSTVINGVTVSQPFSAAGFLNFQTVALPLPKLKFDAYANYSIGGANIRWTSRFIDNYVDQRTAPFLTNTLGRNISSFITHDIAWQQKLPWNSTFNLTVENLFDRDPSFARLELNYDPFTGDPIGRTFKFGIKKKFG